MSKQENRKLGDIEIREYLPNLPGWKFDNNRIVKEFRFSGFPDAIAFMMRVAFEAERLCHHPNWSNVYHTVKVELWSHELGGVSQLCLQLAHCMDSQFPVTIES